VALPARVHQVQPSCAEGAIRHLDIWYLVRAWCNLQLCKYEADMNEIKQHNWPLNIVQFTRGTWMHLQMNLTYLVTKSFLFPLVLAPLRSDHLFNWTTLHCFTVSWGILAPGISSSLRITLRVLSLEAWGYPPCLFCPSKRSQEALWSQIIPRFQLVWKMVNKCPPLYL